MIGEFIEVLRPHCQALYLCAADDLLTVPDLLHGSIGLHVVYNNGVNRTFRGDLMFVLEQAWLSRPTSENVDEQTRSRCLENWPDAVSGEYHPLCCRFPKSCSIPTPENVEPPT